MLISEARSLALKGELATASDKICSLDNDVAQLSFALAIANASAASREVLCSQILGVAADAVSLADEVIQAQAANDRDGDYADPHTSEESPRVMTLWRGLRARRQPAPHWRSLH